MGSFCQNNITFQLKKYRRVIFHDNEERYKVKRKTQLLFQIWLEGFCEFSPNHSKVQKFIFNELFLSKVDEVWAKKTQLSYLSWHSTVMQNLNKPWPCVTATGLDRTHNHLVHKRTLNKSCDFKNGMRNWVNFH